MASSSAPKVDVRNLLAQRRIAAAACSDVTRLACALTGAQWAGIFLSDPAGGGEWAILVNPSPSPRTPPAPPPGDLSALLAASHPAAAGTGPSEVAWALLLGSERTKSPAFGALCLGGATNPIEPGALEALAALVAGRIEREVGLAMLQRSANRRTRPARPFRWDEQQYRRLFENAGVGIFQCTLDGHFVHVNPHMARLFGFDAPDEMVLLSEHPWSRLYADSGRRINLLKDLARGIPGGDSLSEFESEAIRQDGSRFWVSETIRAVRSRSGEVAFFEGTVVDISERRRAEALVQWQASHDPLTHLPNRAHFQSCLEEALEGCRTRSRVAADGAKPGAADHPGGAVAVLLCDLDRFKQINDALGHGIGDRLLQGVSGRLMDWLPKNGTLARMGGDEFTVLLPVWGHSIAESVAEAERMAETMIAQLRPPFLLEGHELFVSASIGIVVAPRDGTDPETLIKHADIALYRAKAAGRGRYEVFGRAMNAGSRSRLALEASLRYAVEREELALLYQPQVDLNTGCIVGVEALLRWNHPTLGDLTPDHFLPLAEETGLIVSIGEWALREACRQAAEWHGEGRTVPVSVNLTVRQFAHPQIVDRVRLVLRETGLPPELLTLELTESAVRESGSGANDVLRALKSCGVGLVIADFGNGLAPLNQLRSMPTDGVKLARTLIDNLPDDAQDRAIVRALIDLAHALHQRTVAVAVEREEQRACLLSLGCDEMQGYLHSRPVPARCLNLKPVRWSPLSPPLPHATRFSPYTAA
ncbi:MAG TPA: EAL domain-containing protein [Armatimonadaceae bacterium]|nr:EAL domain-containing protein [Armatimonadaceae bacterium]